MTHIDPQRLGNLRAVDKARRDALVRLAEFRLEMFKAEQSYLSDAMRLSNQQSVLGTAILKGLGLDVDGKDYQIDMETGLIVENRGGLFIPVEEGSN